MRTLRTTPLSNDSTAIILQQPDGKRPCVPLLPRRYSGVIIDTPEDGASVVRTIKQFSPLSDELLVGDKITAIDEEDIKYLNAIEVSKLISSKMNLQRKFTVVRTC
mmetsp:Transcript_7208/g.14987  ORF Transcript_7208/g.14987 Transcript_7208/m.14987 type:complete len:106 (+) Transcript_7208:783-1100(+)